MCVCAFDVGQTEILLILIAGDTFIYQSNYDNTLSVILSVILIGATIVLLLIFIVQVGGCLAWAGTEALLVAGGQIVQEGAEATQDRQGESRQTCGPPPANLKQSGSGAAGAHRHRRVHARVLDQ